MGSKKLWNLSIASVMAAGSVVTLAPQAGQAADVTFKDMGKNASSYESVMQLAGRGVISGYEDGTFRPYEDITRGQAAKFLTDLLGLDTENVVNPNFKDVSTTHRFYKQIAALSKEGVINGYVDGNYGVNDKLTRGQMAIILGKAYNFEKQPLKTNQFTDVDKKAHYSEYLQALIDNKITFGLTDTSFGPSKFVNRGQMAMFLFRSDAVGKGTTQTMEISSIEDGKLMTSEGIYKVAESLTKLLSSSNAAALKGAKVSVQVKNDEVVSIDKLTLTASGTAVKPLVFDGASSTLKGDLIISGENVLIQNLTISGETIIDAVQTKTTAVKTAAVGHSIIFSNTVMQIVQVTGGKDVLVNFKGASKLAGLITAANLTLQADAGIVIPTLTVQEGVRNLVMNAAVKEARILALVTAISGTGKIDKVVVESAGKISLDLPLKIESLIIQLAKAQITLGDKTSIGNIQLPSGSEPKDIIGNYDSVKDKIENINGKDNPEAKPETPPASGGGGGGGSVSPTVKTVSTSADLFAALNNASIKTIILSSDIIVDKPVVPRKGVTIDGKNKTLTLNAKSSEGNNTAEGLHIQNDNITVENLTVTQTGGHNTDNLIEIYGNNAKLSNVNAMGGQKAGIYVNNDAEGKDLKVAFENISTSKNGWNAGIGILAQKEGSKVIATFKGHHNFGEAVAVYTDNKPTAGGNYTSSKYLGNVNVEGLGNVYANPFNGKDNWGEGASDEVAGAKLLADLAATESGKTVKLYRNAVVVKPVVPPANVTLDGQNHTLTLNAVSTANNNTAEGLHIQNDDVNVKNLKVTQTGNQNTDNLIEVYGNNVSLNNVEATGGKKAGIYVNNNGKGTLTVNFTDIKTSLNGWDAGIGLSSQKENDNVIANFGGANVFGENVAVYHEGNTYPGTYNVSGLTGYEELTVGKQQKWIKNKPLVNVNIPENGFTIGKPTEFTISTEAGNLKGVKVIGNSTHEFRDAITSLEYKEGDTWHKLQGDFGPVQGFPLTDATSTFRVTFSTAGNYEFRTDIREAANTDNVYASTTVEFKVSDKVSNEVE